MIRVAYEGHSTFCWGLRCRFLNSRDDSCWYEHSCRTKRMSIARLRVMLKLLRGVGISDTLDSFPIMRAYRILEAILHDYKQGLG